MKQTKMYMVLKVKERIAFTNPFTGEEVEQKLGGCFGYIPVFDNLKDAEEESVKGKYDIMEIQPK